MPDWLEKILSRPADPLPVNLRHGQLGEIAARKFLCRLGLKFLAANFSSRRGEIDLIFRDGDCLVFVEVKTRAPGSWTRPAAAVNRKKRRKLTLSALDYLRAIRYPPAPIRFDIVEVLLEQERVREVRHLPGSFSLTPPFRFG